MSSIVYHDPEERAQKDLTIPERGNGEAQVRRYPAGSCTSEAPSEFCHYYLRNQAVRKKHASCPVDEEGGGVLLPEF